MPINRDLILEEIRGAEYNIELYALLPRKGKRLPGCVQIPYAP